MSMMRISYHKATDVCNFDHKSQVVEVNYLKGPLQNVPAAGL